MHSLTTKNRTAVTYPLVCVPGLKVEATGPNTPEQQQMSSAVVPLYTTSRQIILNSELNKQCVQEQLAQLAAQIKANKTCIYHKKQEF
jgi:hypothetical protein